MKNCATLIAIVAALAFVDSFSPKTPKPVADFQKTAAGAFAAFTIATSPMNVPTADAIMPPVFSSSNVVSEKVIREGMYGEYEVDLTQTYDDARSTYKSAKETKSKKGKYTAILAILIVGSFIVPMAQYWWYVKDDNSVTDFFNQSNAPPPEPEKPKKKGWF